MKKAILITVLLIPVIAISAAQVSQIAYAGTKKKKVDFLDPDKFSVIVCAVSNQKWTFHSKNYNSIASKGMVSPANVHVMFGIKTGGQRIEHIDIQEIDTKITLTSDLGNVIESTEASLYSGGHNFKSASSTIRASIHGAFSDSAKSITVQGFITAKCSDDDKLQKITVPIEKTTIKLAKGASQVKKLNSKKQQEKPKCQNQ